jgi:hypothetical protein
MRVCAGSARATLLDSRRFHPRLLPHAQSFFLSRRKQPANFMPTDATDLRPIRMVRTVLLNILFSCTNHVFPGTGIYTSHPHASKSLPFPNSREDLC